MNKHLSRICSFFLLFLMAFPLSVWAAVPTEKSVFKVENPDKLLSPYTGMTRQHWKDAATYLLEGAFSYIHGMDDAMKFPKQLDKTYPREESQLLVEKLEGFCRTLFVAAPLLKENPDLKLNNIKVADYYRHQLVRLVSPETDLYVKCRTGGASQVLVEFGGLAISLSVIPEILWNPLTQEQKDLLAKTMLSYGEGPTIGSNWMFFNVFILSFFKEQGYDIQEDYLRQNLERLLAMYSGYGWYNDAPAYDYYSMWAFQTYGPLWAELFGKKQYPDLAKQFLANQADLVDNYPYMFGRDGKMNMWGRSIPYRFASIAPLPLLAFNLSGKVNWGWMRYIASSTILQFLSLPDFLEDRIPTMGFYGPFAPAVQIYSCRGSVFWCGKAFFGLLLPVDSPFWTAKENNGPWEERFKKGHVYNKFCPGSNLLITNYPNSGGSEVRSWCHEKVADDWQKFRSSENYNKLAYHTEFPWMADGKDGDVSMNYATLNDVGQWEVLRLYTFKDFKDGVYRRDAVLETDERVKFQLADIPLPDGVLRIDKVTVPCKKKIRLGHYSLPEIGQKIQERFVRVEGHEVGMLQNGVSSLAMVALYGWNRLMVTRPEGLHPVATRCGLIMAEQEVDRSQIFVTLLLWKKGKDKFTSKELMPIKEIKVAQNQTSVTVSLKNGVNHIIVF